MAHVTTDGAKYAKPLPLPDEDSAPYWQGCKEHQLLLQHCQDCGTYRHRFKVICPNCLSENTEWAPASGKGTVWSWVVVHQAMVAGFKEDVPYILAAIELAEGPRMTANLVKCTAAEVDIGLPVEVDWVDATDSISLPMFKLVRK